MVSKQQKETLGYALVGVILITVVLLASFVTQSISSGTPAMHVCSVLTVADNWVNREAGCVQTIADDYQLSCDNGYGQIYCDIANDIYKVDDCRSVGLISFEAPRNTVISQCCYSADVTFPHEVDSAKTAISNELPRPDAVRAMEFLLSHGGGEPPNRYIASASSCEESNQYIEPAPSPIPSPVVASPSVTVTVTPPGATPTATPTETPTIIPTATPTVIDDIIEDIGDLIDTGGDVSGDVGGDVIETVSGTSGSITEFFADNPLALVLVALIILALLGFILIKAGVF